MRVKHLWSNTAVIVLIASAAGVFFGVTASADPSGVASNDARLALPNAAARQAAEKAVDEVFGQEIAAAKSASERAALAKKIHDLAGDEKDLTQRYVLMNRVRLLAASAGDVRQAMDAAKDLVALYRIDNLRAEVSTLQALERAALNSGQEPQLAAAAIKVLDEPAARDDPDVLVQLDSIAEAATKKSGNPDLIKQFAVRHKQLQGVRHEAERVKPFLEKLAANPNDPTANLEVGRHDCFTRHDWNAGLPRLAKGSDAALKSAAEADLAHPTEVNGKLAVADSWWNLSDKEPENSAARQALRARAAVWYREVSPLLSGLNHLRAEKRATEGAIAETPVSETPSEAAAAVHALPGSGAAQKALVDITAAQIKAKKLTKSNKEPGFTLGNQAFSLVPDNGGLLVGLDVCFNDSKSKVIGVRPLFITPKGQSPGPIVGQSSANNIRLLAKKGYAVGGMTVKGGLGIDGISLTFMQIHDDGLDPNKSYDTPLYGSATAGDRLGFDGTPIVGIYGHHDQKNIAAIGIMQIEMPPAGVKPGE